MTETRETKLTDSEAKMLWKLAMKHGLVNIVGPDEPLECALAFGSELLLAAKERPRKKIEALQKSYRWSSAEREVFEHCLEAFDEDDWGDLFEEKA